MSVLSIVPMRSGSKRIKNKNTKEFLGKPLFWWVCNALEESSVDLFIVSTDSQEYIDQVKKYNFSKVLFHLRSKKTSLDTTSTEDVIQEILESIPIGNQEDNLLLLNQVTSPWVTKTDVDNIIDIYTKTIYNSILSASFSNKFMWEGEGIPVNYDYRSRPRSQDFKDFIYIENGGLYLTTIKNFNKDKNRLTVPIGIYEMPYWTSIELDEEDDWLLLESIMKAKGFESGD